MDKFKDMSYVYFLEKILDIRLTSKQKLFIELFEEVKNKEICSISPYPIYNPKETTQKDPLSPPYISCTKNIDTINNK